MEGEKEQENLNREQDLILLDQVSIMYSVE